MRGNPKQIWVFNTVIFFLRKLIFFSLCVQYISLGRFNFFDFFILLLDFGMITGGEKKKSLQRPHRVPNQVREIV